MASSAARARGLSYKRLSNPILINPDSQPGVAGFETDLSAFELKRHLGVRFSGRYHAFKHSTYARRYLAEAAYRFNRRFRLAQMLPRLLRAMAVCAPRPEPRSWGHTTFMTEAQG